jgi:peptidase MA superfamily protein/tetratricopeptide repeat protein
MAGADAFDLVIFGYRNDLARARTLEFLNRLPLSAAGPTRLDHATAMPQRLFAALDRERAQQLCGILEQFGAQVTLLQAGVPTSDEPPAVLQSTPHTGLRPLTLVLTLMLAAVTYTWRASIPAPRRPALLPPPAAVAPVPQHAPARLEPLREHTELSNEPAAVQLNADAIRLADAADFRAAVDRLHMALSLAPSHPVLARNLQTVLLNWGASDLAGEKTDDAVDHLVQAAQLGERMEVLQTLGVAYARQGNATRAAAMLEQALKLAPNNPNTMVALAQIDLKEDKRPQALDLLQRAKDAGAHGPELDQMLRQLSREVDAEWDFVQLESRHFRVSFADSEDRSAVRQVLDALEDAYGVVGEKLGYYPEERTPVVLYTQQDFHTVTQTPDWAGGAFDGRIKIPVRGLVDNDPNLARVVQHEYTHSVVNQLSGPHCPVWLNEGLAVWAEEREDGDRAGWAENKLADQELFSLDQLTSSFTVLPRNRVEVAYAESYLAVRTLIDRYGTRKIAALLRALGRTHNLTEAFAAVYPGDFAGFQQQLLRQLTG